MTDAYAEDQASVSAWAVATFPGGEPNSSRLAIRALEEMLELCYAAGANCDDIEAAARKAKDEHTGPLNLYDLPARPDKVPPEAADVLITLFNFADSWGFDIHSEVDDKMLINRARRWHANGDGTGYHVKEVAR